MRARILIGGSLAAVLACLAVPAAAAPPAPPSCVLVYFSEGFHVQIGSSAPNGPDSCLRVP